MKLLLDEMYPTLLARELRARGHDVVSVHESPGAGATDMQVWLFAQAAARAVVTENVRDFRPLAGTILRSGGSHAGVVFTSSRTWPRTDPGSLIDALDRLLFARAEPLRDAESWL